jgi:hypothetical protein
MRDSYEEILLKRDLFLLLLEFYPSIAKIDASVKSPLPP